MTQDLFPTFFNWTTNPATPTTYSSTQNYQWNVTVLNTNGSVHLVFTNPGGQTYTATNLGNNLYSITLPPLKAGSYTMYFAAFGSGASHYLNTTSVGGMTVNKGGSLVYAYINNSRSNLSISTAQSLWLNASRQTGEGTVQLYNNGTLINTGVNIGNYTYFNVSGIYNITAIYPAGKIGTTKENLLAAASLFSTSEISFCRSMKFWFAFKSGYRIIQS